MSKPFVPPHPENVVCDENCPVCFKDLNEVLEGYRPVTEGHCQPGDLFFWIGQGWCDSDEDDWGTPIGKFPVPKVLRRVWG